MFNPTTRPNLTVKVNVCFHRGGLLAKLDEYANSLLRVGIQRRGDLVNRHLCKQVRHVQSVRLVALVCSSCT